MPYCHIWIVARDEGGQAIPEAEVMEGDECLGLTGGTRPLPLDPRVYRIHVRSQTLRSEVKRLVLQPNSEQEAPTEVFILTPSPTVPA